MTPRWKAIFKSLKLEKVSHKKYRTYKRPVRSFNNDMDRF